MFEADGEGEWLGMRDEKLAEEGSLWSASMGSFVYNVIDNFQEQLYQLNCREDPRMEHFLARAWCLLKRYQAGFLNAY